MKIAHIFSHFNIGGAQTMMADIMNVQVHYCQVTLFVLLDDINEALLNTLDKRIKVVLLKRKVGSLNYLPYIKLNTLLNFGGYNIVHVHEKTMWEHLYLAPWIRRFQTVHNTGLFSKYYKKCEKIFAISKSVENGLKEKGYTNVVLASNGINCNIIAERENPMMLTNAFRIVQVSRLIISHKGQDLLINALADLQSKGKPYQDTVLDFIGEGKDLSLLQSLVKDKGLEHNVRFLGVRDRNFVYAHLKDYDLFVQPSRYEGFGLTVAEAMAANVPVLVSNNEGPYEIIKGGEFGYAFENGNETDLANKLAYIINNYGKAIEKANKAIDYVKKNFSVERTANIYMKYYKRLGTDNNNKQR